MIVFAEEGCDRDLKRKEARPAGAGKKEAAASERRVPLARLPPNESTAGARPAGRGKKMEEATAEKKKMVTEAEKEEGGDSLFKEGEMLKLREEFWDAELLWSERYVPGALDRWLKRKKTTTQLPDVAVVAKKRKKVVRDVLPDGYIDHMKENSCMMRELSDEEMAQCAERFRQKYAIQKLINAKKRVYQQALIDQYRAFGFAYDEKEVTDNEEEEAVVKT